MFEVTTLRVGEDMTASLYALETSLQSWNTHEEEERKEKEK